MEAGQKPAIDVALATYNGSRHLSEFLDSIRQQRWPNLRVIACDDGSSDETVHMLRQAEGLNIEVSVNPVNLGPIKNFSKALKLTSADYVVLADQDDVWLPTKLDRLMGEVRDVEMRHGADKPVTVFSDLHVVDSDLNRLADSFYDGTFKSRRAAQVRDFTITNHVPGCVMIINRALIDLALPVPDGVFMHDWWLCLVAAACGVVSHVEEPLILFRRHGGNFTGDGRAKVKGAWVSKAVRRLGQPVKKVKGHYQWINDCARNANRRLSIVDERYQDRLTPEARDQVRGLLSRNLLRRLNVLRHGHLGESWNDALLIALRMGAREARDTSGDFDAWS